MYPLLEHSALRLQPARSDVGGRKDRGGRTGDGGGGAEGAWVGQALSPFASSRVRSIAGAFKEDCGHYGHMALSQKHDFQPFSSTSCAFCFACFGGGVGGRGRRGCYHTTEPDESVGLCLGAGSAAFVSFLLGYNYV